MSLPFVGPSYRLADRKASAQRTVNMHLVAMETVEKARFILESTSGLIARYTLGGAIRGGLTAGGRSFVVAGSTLYEIFSNYSATARGTLSSSSGVVDFAYGLSQLVLVDGSHGYTLNLSTNTFAAITAAGFSGAARVAFINGRFVFSTPGTQQYQWSAIDDASSIDALDFASAEAQPDNIVAHLVLSDTLCFFGEKTTEFHYQTGDADLPYQRSSGLGFDIGCAATHSAQKIDNTAYWIGQDSNGSGIVYQLVGRQPKRISTTVVEQALEESTDIASARAFCLQERGLTFYCISAPGLTSVWVYEVSTGSWHERCDLDAYGQFKAHRGTCHLYGFGMHLLGAEDGKLYQLDRSTYTNAGDALVRERVSPHDVVAGRVYQFFSGFFLDCTTGEAPQGVTPYAELSWSRDSGATWSNPVLRSIGAVGQRLARVLWPRVGVRARDIVWKVRFSGDAPFTINDAGPNVRPGTN